MPTPPSYQKVNPADQPILYLALTSPTLPLSAIDEYATTFIAQRISTVSGVAQVQVFGSQKYAVRIQADPRALAARGIGIDELSNAVRANNVNLPTGTLWGPHTAYTVQADGQLQDAKGYQNIIVAFRDGLPMTIVGNCGVMYLLGYSLDNLSLMALTLSVGFVVDDAIVMLENIVRHMEMGEGILEAAYNGSREIAFTIVSMTISLAAVFIPVLFMGGIVGRLFHEFAVTIGAAILVSGFVSLTLTPMLGSRFLRHQKKQHGKAYLTLERGFDAMLGVYERGLKWSLDHRRTVIVFSAIIFIAMIPLFMIVPKGFMPSEDLGGIFGITEAREGISFRALVEHQLQVNRVVKQDANVESFFSSAGSRGGAGGNQGFIFIRLKPRDRRELSADKVVQELRPKLMREVIGMNTYLQPLQPIRIGGTLTKSLYQFTLQDADTKELYRAAPEMEARMRQLPGLQDVTSDLLIRNPQVNVDIDRDKAASQGITPQAIEDALYTAYGSRQVSTIYAPNNEYQVILELKPEFQGDPNAMGMLYIRSSAGQVVPLSSVATLKSTVGPLSVNHLAQLPAVNISFNLNPGVSLGEAVHAVKRRARA